MDVGKFSTVFEDYSTRYWLESIEMLRILCWETVESVNLSLNANRTWWEKAAREIESPAPGDLVYLLRFSTYLTSNIGGRNACTDQKNILPSSSGQLSSVQNEAQQLGCSQVYPPGL